MSIVNLFKYRTHSKERFETLIRPHINSLYRLAYLLCQSQDDAEELVQKLLVKLFQKSSELENIGKLKPWLSRALYNLFVDSFRSAQRHLSLFDTSADVDAELSTANCPAEHTNQLIKSSIINKALDSLNRDQRTIVLLHDVEGYTLKEIEDILQTPEGTVKSRLHRARNNLKIALDMEPFDTTERVKSTR